MVYNFRVAKCVVKPSERGECGSLLAIKGIGGVLCGSQELILHCTLARD